MKRPAMAIGFAYIAGLLAAQLCGVNVSLIGAVVLVASGICALFLPFCRMNFAIPAILLSAGMAFCVYFSYSYIIVAPIKAMNGLESHISGQIVEAPSESYGRTYYVIKVSENSAEGSITGFKIRVSCDSPLKAQPYDRVSFDAKLINPDLYDSYTSAIQYRAKKVFLYALPINNIEVFEAQKRPLGYYFIIARNFVAQQADRFLRKTPAGITKGLLLGDTGDIPDDLKDDFRVSGVSHLFAVSGMNTSIIASLVLSFLLFVRLPRKIAAACSIFFVFFFMGATGFSPSVSRAGIMTILYLAAMLLEREADSLNSLGLAGFLLALINPYMISSPSFLLSFSATFGIIVLSPVWDRLIFQRIKIQKGKKVIMGLCAVLFTTLSATVFSLPSILFFFHEFSLVTLPANLLMEFPSALAMAAAGIGELLSLLPWPVFAKPFFFAAGILALYLEKVARFFGLLPFASIWTGYGFVFLWLIFAIALLSAAVLLLKNQRAVRLTALLLVNMLLLSSLTYGMFNHNVLKLTVVNGTNGNGVLISLNNKNLLLCSGDNEGGGDELQRSLAASGKKKIDLLLLPDNRYSGGFAQKIIEKTKPKMIIAQHDDKAVVQSEVQLYDFSPAVHLTIWNDLRIDIGESCIAFRYGNSVALYGLDKNFKIVGKQPIVLFNSIPGKAPEHDDIQIALVVGNQSKILNVFSGLLKNEIIAQNLYSSTVSYATRGNGIFYAEAN